VKDPTRKLIPHANRDFGARESSMRIGVVGVGAITSDVIEASEELHSGLHTYYLSPRSTERSTKLADKYENFFQSASNQEVVDNSDLVFIGVLPTQIDQLLSELNFRPDQIIASMAAGKPPTHLKTLISPATKVAQLIPLPMIEYKKGPIVICPHIPEISEILTGLGDLIEFEDDSQIQFFSASSAVMSSFFALINEIIDWTNRQGIDYELSARYVTSLVEAIGVKANQIDPKLLIEQPVKHETPGGLNESNRVNLENANWFSQLSDQLDYLINVFIPGLKSKK